MNHDSRENQTVGKWLTDTVRILMQDHLEAVQSGDATQDSLAADVAALEHRFAIGLLQARAFECRTIGNEFLIQGNIAIGGACLDRSRILEALARELATGPWPIPQIAVAR